MRAVLRAVLISSMLVVLGAGLASAQTSFNFSLLVLANGQAARIANGAEIPFIGQVGQATTATITATYTGVTQANIPGPPESWLLGSTDFSVTVTSSVTFPLVLQPQQSLTFTITYSASNTNGASAVLTIPYTEPAGNNTTTSNSITLSLVGSAPLFQLSYVFPNSSGAGNQIPISSGGTIPFPATQINTPTIADLVITNLGSGPGTITAITQPPDSSPFKVIGIPLLTQGFTLAAAGSSGSVLTLQITYTPTAVENDTAQITITYQDGVMSTINLTGSGVASTFTYSYLTGTSSTPIPVQPNGTIAIQGVNVTTTGTTQPASTAIVQVANTGGVSGTINGISISGPGFSLVNPPTSATPLAPGGTFSFTISFTPTQVGTQTGELVIGGAVFTVSGQGLGPQLTFAYAAAGTTVPVGNGGAVAFPPIAVSQSEQVMFTVTNSGTLPAAISLISANAPFSVPAMGPSVLAAGQSTSFAITFSPTTVGPVTGSLLVNNTSIPLVGSGITPPTLPSYTLSGPTGNVMPASQQVVSLTLANSYAVDLSGMLTLTTSSTIGSDPAVQFSTGGRTAPFVIPANTTAANFTGIGSQTFLQTGTVAGTITVTPSFSTSTGGVNLTPTSPTTLQFTIPETAPSLGSLQVTNETASAFTLVITGYSTTRSLSTAAVTLNPASGYTFPTSQFPIDLSLASNMWFQSSSSQAFGGQFQVSIPFALSGTPPKNQTLLQSIASVSVTISNSVGTSSSVQAVLQ